MIDEKPTIIGEEKARQGNKSYQVLIVLVGSLLLAGIGMIVLMGWFGANGPWSM